MELSKRLDAIAGMITPGSRVVDVGCDHAYLPIRLIETGKCPGALACDVNKGPLQAAEKNILAHSECRGKIETRLSDGLANIGAGEGETLVIAGMGGNLTIRILDAHPEIRDSFAEMILQPQSEICEVRLYMQKHGFRIEDEKMIYEDGKYYPMMRVIRGKCLMSPAELEYGPVLIRKRDPVLIEFLRKTRAEKEKILSHLGKQKMDDRICERKKELQQDLHLIGEILDQYETLT